MNWLNCLKELYGNDRFYKEVFDEGMYYPVSERKCDVVIDVGGCGGEFSYWVYDKATQIYTIEPHPDDFKKIKLFTDCHELNKIKYFNIALGESNCRAFLGLGTRGGHTLIGQDNGNCLPVRVETLATFMSKNKIEHVDVLKIDIEDGERFVFGASDFPSVANKIDFIIGEHGTGNNYLEQNGFTITNYEHGWIAKR